MLLGHRIVTVSSCTAAQAFINPSCLSTWLLRIAMILPAMPSFWLHVVPLPSTAGRPVRQAAHRVARAELLILCCRCFLILDKCWHHAYVVHVFGRAPWLMLILQSSVVWGSLDSMLLCLT